jgi:all-trans-8'-apo-beta-carotenal 15,15'-oxygenase
MISRRDTFRLAGGAAALLTLEGCAAAEQKTASPPLPPDRQWLADLGKGLETEMDYQPVVEGNLPPGLSGTLFRNGPGLFERDGFRKRTLVDGDGMIRALDIADGRLRFRTRFVRTPKYQEEAAAGRFLYPTWTTPAPGFFENIPAAPARSQAGITPVVKNGVLYAFDELGDPFALDPASLATMGQTPLYNRSEGQGPTSYKAHTRTDAATGAWILVGTSGRISPALHVLVKESSGRQKSLVEAANPRSGHYYFHDFFWTGRRVVFHLHPARLSPFPMLAGLESYVDSLEWRPEEGSLLLVVDPDGQDAPVAIEMPPCWMWHTLNAQERDGLILADFVGYDAPDHFFGADASFRAIMQGSEGRAKSPGTLRRLVIDPQARSVRVEILSDRHQEFPTLHPAWSGRDNRYGYSAVGDLAQSWFHDGVARHDLHRGQAEIFRFGPGHYVGEPMVAPDPASGREEDGWLICEVLEGASRTSFLAVFEAARLGDGPVARIRLTHHLPFSFHGWWQPAVTA